MARRRRQRRAHGSIRQRGASFTVRWRENGQRRSESHPDRPAAEAALAVILGNISAGRVGREPKPRPVPTISTLAAAWLARRMGTNRAARDDRNRWNKHLEPEIGQKRPAEVTQGFVRVLVERKLGEGLSSTSCKHIVRLLSTFYTDTIEQGYATTNPARALPRATRRLIKDAHDPRTTPFIEKQADIARVYAKLAEPFATMFITGALSGLRPGELIGLAWGDIDLPARRMLVQRQVRHGKVGPTKSGKPRLVPIIDPLATVLAEWKLATGGEGLVFKPLTPWRQRSRFIKDATMRTALRGAIEACGLPAMTWYHASRHTFASQHVMGGGSLAVLQELLGHSGIAVTQRYAHLNPNLFRPEDLLKLSVSLSREGAQVVDIATARAEGGARGVTVGSADDQDSSEASVTS
jgi:integrase